MAEHRTALLGKAGHVQAGGGVAIHMRGHCQHGGDGGDARTANASEQHVPRLRQSRRFGQGQARIVKLRTRLVLPGRLAILNGHEARAEAPQAGQVRVTG